ncbi:MAG: patatin-like phospholipase family protein [Chloroflexi bacterium]|nr:patatin-like phospholipase family protein [Chloroflexota bacterium]
MRGPDVCQERFPLAEQAQFINQVLPRVRHLLTTQDLEFALIGHVARLPWRLLHTRADDLSLLMQKRWGMTARLCDVPPHPHWMINATCYETGRNRRFERSRMGDSAFGYTCDTDIPLSDALAASSGFPGLIGPLEFDTSSRQWFKPVVGHAGEGQPTQPAHPRLHLWDGGVYDNLGLEGMHSFLGGWQQDIDLLIVSDACAQVRPEPYHAWRSADRMVRGIMMEQIRSLRFRALVERFINHGDRACYLQIGQTREDVLQMLGLEEEASGSGRTCLSQAEVDAAADMPTDIRRVSEPAYERLFRHGYEVADYTLEACYPGDFGRLGYRRPLSGQAQPAAPQSREPLLAMKQRAQPLLSFLRAGVGGQH